MIDPYYQGYLAAWSAEHIATNPHPPGVAHDQWHWGHIDAQADAWHALYYGQCPVVVAQFDAAQRQAMRRDTTPQRRP